MRTLQTTKARNKRMKLLQLLVGRAIDHTHEEKIKKPFTVPSGPTILLTCEKIIIGSPDFFYLYKNLPHCCKVSVFKSQCAFIYNKPCSHQKAALAQPTIPSLLLMKGYHSKHHLWIFEWRQICWINSADEMCCAF